MQTADDYYDAVLRFGNYTRIQDGHSVRYRTNLGVSMKYDIASLQSYCSSAKRAGRHDEWSLLDKLLRLGR